MIRRNTEGKHNFSLQVGRACNIYDMQGLLMNEKNKFTAAVEAFEMKADEKVEKVMGNTFSEREFYIKSCFAERVNVSFFLFIHREGTKKIYLYEIKPDHKRKSVQSVAEEILSEEDFIDWWGSHKRTIQRKGYRGELKDRIQLSYFDSLLESRGLKWGGNVDGFMVSAEGDSTEEVNIISVIENRFTNKKSIRQYDPADYFKSGGGDYRTWFPLIKLKEMLGIPLFIFTYSNRKGEENLVGATLIEALNEQGITYIQNGNSKQMKPCDNLFDNTEELVQWVSDMVVCHG